MPDVTILVTTRGRIDPIEAAEVKLHKLEKLDENMTKVMYKYRIGNTNMNGMVQFNVSRGKYIVEIVHPFMKQKVMETIDINSDVKLVYEADLIFPVTLTIKVIDLVTRNPLSDVEIEIYLKGGPLVHYSKFSGEFSKKLDPGTYLVSLRKDGYEWALLEVIIENEDVKKVVEMRPLLNRNS